MLAAAFGGALLLVGGDFARLFEIKAASTVVDSTTGGSHHSYALVAVGLGAMVMAYGTARGSRPAGAALLVLGAAAALVVFAVDLPDIHRTGVIGRQYDNAAARPALGFYLETLGTVLLVIAGVGGLVLGTGAREPASTSPRSADHRAAEAARHKRT